MFRVFRLSGESNLGGEERRGDKAALDRPIFRRGIFEGTVNGTRVLRRENREGSLSRGREKRG